MNNRIPSVAFEYWGWTHPPIGILPGMYGMDSKRSECHDRLCAEYGINKEITRKVTDHLDKYDHAVSMHDALLGLQDKNHER